MTDSITREQFRTVMGSFVAGVTVVTTLDAGGAPFALTATAFSSLSADPPLCLVCVDHASRAHGPALASRRFAVNFLEASQSEVSAHFASKEDDKFASREWRPGSRTGCPILPGVLAYLECEVQAVHPGGDHDIFVGRLLGSEVFEGAPLVHFRGGYADVTRR